MPEGNEQPALLGDESEKKPKRTRSAPGSSAKRTPARKAGGKKPTKSIDLQVGEPSQGQLLETANRPSDQGNSERTAVDGSVRPEVRHSLAEDQGSQSQERQVANHRTNAASEVNETQELAPAENGKHRAHGEITVEQPKPEPVYGEGLIEVSGKGFGFLRDPKRNYVQSPQDIFVTPEVVRKHALRDGLWIKGEIRRGSRGPQLFKLTEINGEDPERYRNLPVFEELTSINPTERIRLETVPDRYTTRVMDLMTPIGKGQRGLIVAPPRTGKTTLLQHIADAVVRNHPETSLIILLVDERPEEVTEIRRTVPKADIMASSNDSDIKSHTRIAQLAIERAKRLVEANRDVFVLMDSLTRVGRAFNNASAGSGRTMSGGMDSRAMEIPRKLFAAARNTEEAGSLTIMATALIETGSKMDELIFQEFKGTGNMEMVLDRQISDQRTYPSVDIFKSGTRREELLLPQKDLEKINTIRRGLAGHRPTEAIERLLSFLRKFPTNAQMLREIPG
jgi:transcription termination factor Rho